MSIVGHCKNVRYSSINYDSGAKNTWCCREVHMCSINTNTRICSRNDCIKLSVDCLTLDPVLAALSLATCFITMCSTSWCSIVTCGQDEVVFRVDNYSPHFS